MKKTHILSGSAFLAVVLAAVLIQIVSATGSSEPPLLDEKGLNPLLAVSGPAKTLLGWNSTTETLNGGKKRYEIHAKQINFKDVDGAFKPINVTPVSTTNGWEITQNTFIARFPTRSAGMAEMVNNNRFDTRTLTTISEPVQTMTITALGVSDVPGVLEYGDLGYGPEWYVRYPQAYPAQNADLIYLVWQGKVPRLQKLVRFNSALASNADFRFQFSYPDKDPDFTPSTGAKWSKTSELTTNRAISVGKAGDKHGFGMKAFRIWDTGIGAGRKAMAVNVDVERNAQGYVLTKHIPASFFHNVAYPAFTDTTITVYPDPNTETTTVDGTAYRNVDPSSETWSQVRDSAGNAHTDTDANNQIWAINGGSSSGQYSYNIRGIFLFNISSVPDTDTIISATESFYAKSAGYADHLSCASSDNSKIVLVNASPASNTALADSDYGNVGSTEYGRSVKQSSLTMEAYNDITLTATGITALASAQAGTNIFKTGTRSGWDVDNLAPFSNGCTWAYQDNTVLIANADTSGTSQDPKLVIESVAAPSYTDTGASVTAYYYRVRAYNSIGNSEYSNTALNRDIITVSGDITSASTWHSSAVYVIDGTVTVTGVTLTIEPGTVVKFKTSSSKLVIGGNGILDAQGTSANKIYFTSYNDDAVGGDTNATTTPPAADDWNAIKVESGATGTIAYAVIRYGSGSTPDVSVWNSGGMLTISNSEVATGTLGTAYGIYAASGTTTVTSTNVHGFSYGIEKEGGTLVVSASNIHDNSAYGVLATGGDTTLNNNTFSGNPSGAAFVDFDGQNVFFTHSGNTSATGSGITAGIVVSGAVGADQTWTADGPPYVISNLSVPSGKTLTIGAGAILKFNAGIPITVSGSLRVQGTSGSKAYFTSIKDDSTQVGGDTNGDGSGTAPAAGNWDAIKLDSGASSTIAFAVVRYGDYGSNEGEVYNDGGILTLDSVEVATSSNLGIYTATGTTTIYGASIHNNVYGVLVDGGTTTIADSMVYSNSAYGLYNNTVSTITAENNWWGITWGPHSSTNGSSGNSVTDYVDYDPWRHVNNPFNNNSVHGGQIRWYGTSDYIDNWNIAVDVWNGTDAGIILILEADATSTANLVISDTSTSAWPAQYSPGSLKGTTYDWIEVSPSVLFGFNVTYFPYGDEAQSVTFLHELGHGLGLGHSANDDSDNVMATSVHPRTTLGDEDKADYNFLWSIMSWAIPY